MHRPLPTLGMRHVALNVGDMDACERFYAGLLGMQVEWRPDADNVYFTSGNDNLALHRGTSACAAEGQRLDHIGFFVGSPEQVDEWYKYLLHNDVPVRSPPKTHRDGARSFYCSDPEGVTVQVIFHPPISS